MAPFPGYKLVKQHLLLRNNDTTDTSSTNTTTTNNRKEKSKKKKNLKVQFAPGNNNSIESPSSTSPSSSTDKNKNKNDNNAFVLSLTTIYHVERLTDWDDNLTRQDLWYSIHEQMNFRQRDQQLKHLLRDGADLAQVELQIKLMLKMKQKKKERNSNKDCCQQTNNNNEDEGNNDGYDDVDIYNDTKANDNNDDGENDDDDDDDSPRGLEYAQPEYAKKAEERRKNAKNAVLATQTLFKKKLQKDGTESIARAYNLCCASSKQDAVDIALHDYRFVIDHVIANNDTNNSNRSGGGGRQSNRIDPLTGRIISLEKKRSERPALLKRQGVTSVQK